ncbi:S-methyl-5-thioribose-1-phosphate isomerase [Methanopyrus sp. SNP6]|uniref:S-methyl-5-thioribose-1-phosphate isomerase n=1 Tax=Methanopyrus sp. SNP6 TaxID=1937005 RepID=UPI001F01E003|nr:S-methyl-5-thioribose-1-phosphate isomerase [Methanopyrus sp. SNP6]
MSAFKTLTLRVYWDEARFEVLDQTELPDREVWRECTSYKDAAEAIENMRVRGAPLIGAVAALGAWVAYERDEDYGEAIERLRNTRPTARNLFWALERMEDAQNPRKEVERILREDVEVNRKLGDHGAELLPDECTVLTHCNAGALACVDWGTALGVVRSAVFDMNKEVEVIATETRPVQQGARLTCWELSKDGIPVKLIADTAVGYVMSKGKVDAIIVGADRIALDGSVANKIGTYQIAVLADRHDVPFYVAAPTSTIDPNTETGEDIPIEHRSEEEVKNVRGVRVAPEDVTALNPAFDVTPPELIDAIITEKGVVEPQEVADLV